MRLLPVVLLVTAAAVTTAAAKPRSTPATALGHLEFPVTGSEPARRHFLRGLLALHSFWYEEARDEFHEATHAQPDFAMGYWGEALTWFHPIWEQEDVDKTRAALDKISAKTSLTARERAFVDAAHALVGPGDFAAHAQRYADAMRAVHERFASDDEAATLYAVALLGTVDRSSSAYRRQAEAAAIALDVFGRNPEHPGAAHYIIHAFDDPDHAVLALPAARRYAQIAPEAYHARHMPSHIFVHLGMWPEAAASNESSWEASQSWIRKKKLDASLGDFHSLSWLHAIYLEQGQRKRAEEVLDRARAAFAAAHEERAGMRVMWVQLVAKSLAESNDWSRLDERLALLATPEAAAAVPTAPMTTTTTTATATTTTAAPATSSATTATPAAAGCHPAIPSATRAAQRERAWVAWMRAEAALARKDIDAALQAADLVRTASEAAKDNSSGALDGWRAAELQIRGRAAALRGAPQTGIKLLQQAADLEDHWTPSGPILGCVSARERLGELLLAGGHAADALEAFRRALALHPRRARVLLGAARAATAAQNPAATAYWTELASVWSHADPDQPGLERAHQASAAR